MEEVTTIGPDERVHGLHLRNRGIHTLPAIVGALGALRTLLLDSNDLVLLPQSMGGLLRLERLGLSHNDLSVLPDTLTALGIWIESTVCSGPCGSSDCCYTEYTNGLDVEGNRLCVVAARVAEWLDEHQPSWPATQRCGEPE
jgi:Leucine-rich repeat (LRR) protein